MSAFHSLSGDVAIYVTYTNWGRSMLISFGSFFEVPQRIQGLLFVLLNPALVYFVDRDGVKIVQLLAPPADSRDKIGVLQAREVLRDRLARHREVRTQFPQRLAPTGSQAIEQAPSRGISEGLEDRVHVHAHKYMQENTCMSSAQECLKGFDTA